jgi:putative peptidoglycan lipid II flippase
MSVGTVLSRVTGLLRLAALSAALGVVASGRLTDTYNLGNTAPNILYELVLGGVLTSVFVPVFVELLEKEGRERAWEVASAIINLSIVVLAAFTTIGILAAPWIAKLYASRLHGSEAVLQRDVLTFLLRLFIPQIIFYGLYAVTSGLLNAHRRFGPPMYTPVLGNLAVIATFLAFHHAYSHIDGLADVSRTQLLIIGGGTTLGIVLQGVAQIPFLRGLGRYRVTFSIAHPAVKKLARLSVFVIGYVVANQIGYLIVQYLANKQTGGYSAYVAAFTFYMLPHGLFAVSIITALLPGMSEYASGGRWDLYRERLSIGIRSTLLLIAPAAVGYLVLGRPIVRLLLQYGVMGAADVTLVATVLRFFVIGLVPFALFQLLLRAFYALQDTKTPFLINCVAVFVNIGVNIPLFAAFGVKGLALGHAIAYTLGVVMQWRALAARVGGLDGPRIAATAAKVAGAAIGMGAVVWALYAGISHVIDPTSVVSNALLVLVPVAGGAASYYVLGSALRIEELAMARDLIVRRGS